MRAYERLIQYARIHTASSEEGPYRVPSTERQFDLGRLLVQQMQELGVTDARIDEHCYVYGSLPATPGYEQAKKLGFIAHMDTIPGQQRPGAFSQGLSFSGSDDRPHSDRYRWHHRAGGR